MNGKVVIPLVAILCSSVTPAMGTNCPAGYVEQAGKCVLEWVDHIEWCRQDGGQPPCTNRVPAPCTLFGGGRQCMIDNARDAARLYQSNPGAHPLGCDTAYELVKACQCHNKEAEDSINRAGRDAVCGYLATH